jgi:hypothetical protein
MELAALIAGIASAIALVGTLLLVARQARSLASQTELANKLAVHSATNDGMKALRSIYLIFVDHPELRRYFYDGAQLSKTGESEHGELAARVMTIAEFLADTLERATQSTSSLGAPDRDRSAWEDSIAHYLSMSPSLRAVISTHPTWWPSLNDRLLRLTPATRSDDS